MIRSILAALDTSVRAKAVLRAATQLAELSRAQLYLFRAIHVPPEFPAAAGGASRRDDLVDVLIKEAEGDLNILAGPLDASYRRASSGVGCARVIATGTPWRAILETAASLHVDLIVLGNHGYKGLDRVLGTTAGKVVNGANTDVLIIHDKTRRAHQGSQ